MKNLKQYLSSIIIFTGLLFCRTITAQAELYRGENVKLIATAKCSPLNIGST